MQNEELYEIVKAMPAQVEKVKTEITGKLADLEAALAAALAAAGGEVPSDVVAAIDSMKAAIDTLDAFVPDVA